MRNLKALLTDTFITQLKDSAKELGFTDPKLYKTSASGHLGVYVKFDGTINPSEYDSRSLALTYKLSQIALCKVGVVSNQDDPDASQENAKTLEFDKIASQDFQNVFGCSPEEIEIEDLGEYDDCISYKVYYEHFFPKIEATPSISSTLSESLSVKDQDKKKAGESELITPYRNLTQTKNKDSEKPASPSKRKISTILSDLLSNLAALHGEELDGSLDEVYKGLEHLKQQKSVLYVS